MKSLLILCKSAVQVMSNLCLPHEVIIISPYRRTDFHTYASICSYWENAVSFAPQSHNVALDSGQVEMTLIIFPVGSCLICTKWPKNLLSQENFNSIQHSTCRGA